MIPKLCAVGLLGAILAAFLGELGFRNKKLLSLLTAIILLCSLNEHIDAFIQRVTGLSDIAGINEACSSALKAVGLGYVFGFTSDVCCELGEVTVGKALTAVGRVEIFLVVLPYFEKTISLGLELLQ